jgi:2-dehydro-3-deoxyphosphogluconate aldolase/(4S)-4-hydroxy-2-oxoglutarate aldolase
VAVVDAPEDALPMADALLAAGLPVVEVTLRTPATLEAIRLLRIRDGRFDEIERLARRAVELARG